MKLKDNHYISVKQAADLLGVYPQKLHYYLSSKQPPPHTIQGGHTLFEAIALKKWWDNLVDRRVKND